MNKHPDYAVNRCPEAMGVDITSTMKSIGISLEWPPEKLAYQIALAGKKLKKNHRAFKRLKKLYYFCITNKITGY